MMRSRPLFALSAGILAACGPSAAAQHVISATALPAPIASNALRPVASIPDRADRSRDPEMPLLRDDLPLRKS